MLTLRTTSDVAKVVRDLDAVGSRHIPRSTLIALTASAKASRDDLIALMPRAFDKPTPYTLNSLWIKSATKDSPSAEVKVKDRENRTTSITPINYLAPEIYGGQRNTKGFEMALQRAGLMRPNTFALPSDAAPRDRFGNVSGAFCRKILAALKNGGSTAKAGARRKGNPARPDGYFVVLDKVGKMVPGIYEKHGFAHGSSVRPIFVYVNKRPTYRKRLDFFGSIDKSIANHFPDEFAKALSDALSRWGE